MKSLMLNPFKLTKQKVFYRVPREGLIGYTTNSPSSLKAFMSFATPVYNFKFLDFKGAEDKSIDEKIKQTEIDLLS